jgi:hypothetical protein
MRDVMQREIILDSFLKPLYAVYAVRYMQRYDIDITFRVRRLLGRSIDQRILHCRSVKNHSPEVCHRCVNATYRYKRRGGYNAVVLKLRNGFIKAGRSNRGSSKNRISLQSRRDGHRNRESVRKTISPLYEGIP